MRHRRGIVLGAAVAGGFAAASLAAGQAGPRTAIEVIAPASVVGGGLLGSPSHAAPVPGLAPGWLLVPTLPDLSVPAVPSHASGSPAAVAAPSTGTPAPAQVAAPIAAVLTALPVHLPVLGHGLPTLPLPISLPPVLGTSPAPGHTGGQHSGGQHHLGDHRRG